MQCEHDTVSIAKLDTTYERGYDVGINGFCCNGSRSITSKHSRQLHRAHVISPGLVCVAVGRRGGHRATERACL